MVSASVMEVQEPVIVFEAAALTLAIVAAITVFAHTTKNDFTIFGPVMMIVFFILLTVQLFAIMFGPRLNFVYTAIAAFFSSFYLLYDTQLILSGTSDAHRQYKIDEESYILAAMILYLDIIQLFLYIL